MNTKVIHTLEFDKIRNMLAKRTVTPPGRKLADELFPATDIETIEYAQTLTQEAVTLLLRDGGPSIGTVEEIASILARTKLGASASPAELVRVRALAQSVRSVFDYAETVESGADSLKRLMLQLIPMPALLAALKYVHEEGLYDEADPALADVRRKIGVAQENLRRILHEIVHKHSEYLQEPIITMRNDRYCIPVKSEYKQQVRGMVHDSSASGSTFFIEPVAVMDKNNEIAALISQESREVDRILAEMSAKVQEFSEELQDNLQTLGHVDFTFAKGELALSMNATRPLLHSDHRILLKQARHPLLDTDRVVPIDLKLDSEILQLIITGPNTGGKTVTLKTVGLFTLMAQAGLHIPVRDRSEITVYDEIFADIGDEQSIEQNLSTFSSHMSNIVRILNGADSRSLVLFDELGAGTDPVEGAALALSILEHLRRRKIATFATTHYSEIKYYASGTEGVVNASCEFDLETLRPTYRLQVGIAGKSNAFAISKRLGLPDEIIETAKENIEHRDVRVEDILSELNAQRAETQRNLDNSRRMLAEAEEAKQDAREEQRKLDEKKDRVLAKAQTEASRILQEAKDVADETIQSFHKFKAGADMKAMEKQRAKVGSKLKATQSRKSITPDQTGAALDPKKLEIGDPVYIKTYRAQGTVSSLPDAKGNLFVTMGIMKMKVNLKDLAKGKEVETVSYQKKGLSGSYSHRNQKAAHISPEIKLLGYRADEAIAALEKYIDDAVMAGLDSVRIVHGKGSGQLRKAVHQYLKKNKSVASFDLAEYGAGDAGVTVAKLR